MKGHNQPRYLTEAQLSQLIKAARKGRYGGEKPKTMSRAFVKEVEHERRRTK